jgi:hypothetical protein
VWLIRENPWSRSRRAESGSATGSATNGIKDFVESVDFHLVDDLEELAEAAFGKAFFAGEPR